MSFLVSKPERIRRWVSEKFIVEGLRDLELFGEQPPGDTRRKTNEASAESIASFSKQEIMSSFLPEGGCYELLTVIGKGFEDLMTVNLARYKPAGEYVTVRRINLEACSNEMVTFLQGELHVSKLFSHPNILPYRATFIADNELWVVTSFMAYGSAKDLICTHFTDGMNELTIAYILQGALKALDYIHHMGYVHRSVKASHVLISADGKVYLSGLRSNLSMISHGQRQRVVHDFPKYSIKVLPWLSPEVLQQNLQGYDAKSDIYSVGITACELANGHVPFKDMPATQREQHVQRPRVKKEQDRGFPGGAVVESPPADAGDMGSCPGPGRSHMPQSGWAREPWPLSLRIRSLCFATGEATTVRGPCTAKKKKTQYLGRAGSCKWLKYGCFWGAAR
ncbi:STE20-related kinase adapter protein alpha isoform X5 [Lagenorhynchus albirostris]|uniref:STE20-related kinase adapter protein alpha isoform X5 n=1 Tax=Lagenorhynchus albirostris TaxID=27610 RepID=UPI0028F10D8F|nr:STE20-related kinase adapter protein alpha isoform X5 [Lagenorhynchus albirostris]